MKTVLFVCVHNSGRSQMAEAFFNRLAGGKAQALSAGTQPADRVNPVVVKAMREAGIDVSGNRPKALTDQMLAQARLVITMGCGVEATCPVAPGEVQDWDLPDPRGKPLDEVRRIRDEIRDRVAGLVAAMTSENQP